jgi:hypothetical protein
MKNLIMVLTCFFTCAQTPCLAEVRLISPAPARDSAEWVLQLNIPLGMIGITKSNESGRQVDARILNCVGFGPSYQRQIWVGRNYTTFAVTLAALFFPQIEAGVFPWDIGAGLLVTAFNGYGVGVGWNAGKVEGKDINRLIGMLIYDVNAPWKNK